MGENGDRSRRIDQPGSGLVTTPRSAAWPWEGFRLLLFLAFLAACALAAHKFGTVAFVLVAGFVAASIQLPVLACKAVIAPLIWGIRCPTCRDRSLVLVACISFGDRFYRCRSCGQRCKRSGHDSPWRDASDERDYDMYKPVPAFGPARRREASRKALEFSGWMIALLVVPMVVGLFVGIEGVMIGSLAGSLAMTFLSGRDGGKVLPTRPVMWDREVDLARAPDV
jgi:hypothetical protein